MVAPDDASLELLVPSAGALAVGEPGDEYATDSPGSVHVFRRSGTTWGREAFLQAAPAHR
jgi:hypothetical protein